MAQAQAMAARGLMTRRNGAVLIAVALVLAVASGFIANAYIADEARKVSAPVRSVWVAAKDVAAGTLLVASDAVVAQIPIPDEFASHYVVSAGDAGPVGVTTHALRKGQPIMVGTLLAPEAAGSVAALIPLSIRVGTQQQPVAGGLNIPVDRFVAPPPPVRVHDRIDLWAAPAPAAGGSSTTRSVLSNVEIVAMVGDPQSPQGFIVAVTLEQLDRFLLFMNSGAPMIATVRSARTN